jgi:hypothetical protein
VLGEFCYPEKSEAKPGLACADSFLIYPILPRIGRTIEAHGPVRCSERLIATDCKVSSCEGRMYAKNKARIGVLQLSPSSNISTMTCGWSRESKASASRKVTRQLSERPSRKGG